jgi:protein-S-isoprenylcysteine O-methyltransferase Ste14
MALSPRVGKILYAVIFCLVIPLLLILWAHFTVITFRLDNFYSAGIALTVLGVSLVIWGMHDLWFYGKGLPMNGYPPAQYVQSGIYRIFNHPIYVGFCLACAGVACWANSASGLFLVTPVTILSCWALVIGYEEPDLKKRFGEVKSKNIFTLMEEGEAAPSFSEKLKSAVAVFLPWFLLYELFVYLGVSNYFLDTTFQFEKLWPVWEWAEVPYLSIYLFVGLAPFVQNKKTDLRNFMLVSWLATGGAAFVMFVFPFYASQRPTGSNDFLSELILWERNLDSQAAAFPSFHVIWAFVAAYAWTTSVKKLKWVWWSLAIMIALSCIATGNHSIADVIAGWVVFVIVINRQNVWRFFQSSSEKLANSWRAKNIGPLRVINHSLYAGLACFAGIFLVAQFVEDSRSILLVTTFTLLGGAIWGQFAEGSSIMLRPFGYYGAIAGGIIGTWISYFFLGTSLTILITSFALASPVIQGVGRLRCLVQGCCHGAITSKEIGIVYLNEHSRVCQISGMRGVPVHNTQLYSMIGNFITGALIWRLWYGGASASLILGLYFILNGIARFVEEAYRGEVQTKIIFNLRLYQWLAILSLVLGAFITTLNTSTAMVFRWNFGVESLSVSFICGLLSAFAMGMDFPKSKIPFSKLTG